MVEEAAARNYEFMDEEARRKHEEELEAKLQEYMESRRAQREADDAELEELKEKMAERKLERAREMEGMQERMREAEERRKADEEEKKARIEEERLIRIEKKQKTGGTSIYDIFGRGGGPKEVKKEMSEEEAAQMKTDYLAQNIPQLDIDSLGTDDLKNRIKQMYEKVMQLEGARYDLETRQKSQEYDLRELKDRQSQLARNKAAKMGLDAEEAAKSKHPPKIKVVTKYDRQVDRRPYGERKCLYNKPATEKVYKIFHGSGRPPKEWKPRESEEVENMRKQFEGFKYVEAEPLEGAKAPVPVIPPVVPEKDSYDLTNDQGEVVESGIDPAPPAADEPGAEGDDEAGYRGGGDNEDEEDYEDEEDE